MFTSRLTLTASYTPDLWIFAAPLTWIDPVFGELAVPVGFITDLASIPRALRNLPMLDPNGLSRRPAAMHDWLYAERSHGKEFADNFFRAALMSEGATEIEAETFYQAVHQFGSSSWASDAGALESRDFDTPELFAAWNATQISRSADHAIRLLP